MYVSSSTVTATGCTFTSNTAVSNDEKGGLSDRFAEAVALVCMPGVSEVYFRCC